MEKISVVSLTRRFSKGYSPCSIRTGRLPRATFTWSRKFLGPLFSITNPRSPHSTHKKSISSSWYIPPGFPMVSSQYADDCSSTFDENRQHRNDALPGCGLVILNKGVILHVLNKAGSHVHAAQYLSFTMTGPLRR